MALSDLLQGCSNKSDTVMKLVELSWKTLSERRAQFVASQMYKLNNPRSRTQTIIKYFS